MAEKVKNYLKSFEEVTAPLNWKSSPDSPETQLAYVTQPEIDMLVKANLHGSMDGKPNVGPEGIMSLDGDPENRKSEKISKTSFGKQMGVTIDTSTKAGQDKKQKFRDRTGSKVISDREKKGRKDLGRQEGKKGKLSDREYEKKWGETKGGEKVGTGTVDIEDKTKKSFLDMLKSPDISDPLADAKRKLILEAVRNYQKGWDAADYGFLEQLGMVAGPLAFRSGYGLLKGPELYRDDDLGFPIGGWSEGMNVAGTYPGSFTAEGLDDFIRSIDPEANILGQLERHNPEIFHLRPSTATTTGGLVSLANENAIDANNPEVLQQLGLTKEEARKYNNKIFNARQELDRQGKDRQGNPQKNMAQNQISGGGGTGAGTGTGTGTGTSTGTGTGSGAGNQFAVAPEGKIGYTPDTLGTIDPVTGKPIGYQWGSLADYTPHTQVNLTDMSYYNPLEAYEGFNPLAGYVYNDGGIVQLGHGGYLDDYAAADSLMFKDPQDEEEWEYNV